MIHIYNFQNILDIDLRQIIHYQERLPFAENECWLSSQFVAPNGCFSTYRYVENKIQY